MSVELRFDMRRFNRALRRAPKQLDSEMRVAFRRYLRQLQAKVITERLSGDPLRRRTGALARSWMVDVVGHREGITGILSNSQPYAAIHEFGGTIRAAPGKWLWIPSEHLRTAAGVFRGWDDVDWDRVFYVQSKRNPQNLVAMQRFRLISGSYPVATLAKEVNIPPRLGLKSLVAADTDNRVRQLNKAVNRAISRAAR